MPRRLALVLGLTTVVAGCTAHASAGQELRAVDGSLNIRVPPDWTATDSAQLEGAVVLAAEGPGGIDQVVVSRFDERRGTEDQAVWIATGLADGGILCERLDQATALGGRLVLDCPTTATRDEPTIRRLLVPVVAGGGSVLVFVQTTGESLDAVAGTVEPILDSLRVS